MDKKDINMRLENWARWATAFNSGRPSDSMTGIICESMRKAALGDVWSGHQIREEGNTADALAIERGMRFLTMEWRMLLWWHYIKRQIPEIICRKMGYAARPSSIYQEKFISAQQAIAEIVDKELSQS